MAGKLENCVIKKLVLFFYQLFFLLGVSGFGYGIYAAYEISPYRKLTSTPMASASLLIVIGVIAPFVALCGHKAAKTNEKAALGILFRLMLILLGFEIAAAMLSFHSGDTGCAGSLKKELVDKLIVVGTLAAVVLVIQIVGMACTVFLIHLLENTPTETQDNHDESRNIPIELH